MTSETTQADPGDWVRRTIIYPLEAALFFTLLCLFSILPRRAASFVGGAIAASLGPRFSQQHTRAMSRNFAIAFPELGSEASAALQRRIWRHFGRVLSQFPHIPRLLRRPHVGDIVEVEGAEYLAEAARSGRFLLVGAHVGHWELTGCYAALAGYPMAALYTPERNGWIDAMIRFLRRRGSAGSRLIARGPNAVRQMMEVLKKGQGLFIIVDQRVDDGAWLPYFGKLAQTTTAPARLARRFDCPILLGRAILLPKGRYRISYHKPLRPDLSRDADADVLAMTQEINDTFEFWVREHPEQWLCMKRRWPKSPKDAKSPSPKLNIPESARRKPRVPAEVD
jgi:KDO2-lipid IV(A) lauroyltransferase